MFRNRTLLGGFTGLVLGVVAFGAVQTFTKAASEDKAELAISHAVYFTLKDSTAETRAKLVADCKKYLAKPEGSLAFAAGVRDEQIKSAVNDKDFDVALMLVFKNKEAFDKYAVSEPHQKFIAENKDNWKSVRVYDARVSH
jgi:hypothetical protein